MIMNRTGSSSENAKIRHEICIEKRKAQFRHWGNWILFWWQKLSYYKSFAPLLIFYPCQNREAGKKNA